MDRATGAVRTMTAHRPGLQPERTALGWQRTGISAGISVLPLLAVDAQLGSWLMAGVSAVAGVVITAFVLLLRRRVSHLSAERLDLSPWPDIARLCAATVVLALLGVITAAAVIGAG